jgi:hypothetical protein
LGLPVVDVVGAAVVDVVDVLVEVVVEDVGSAVDADPLEHAPASSANAPTTEMNL